MTLILFFLLAFGFLCAWFLLKAVNWLPLVLLLSVVGVVEGSNTFQAHNSGPCTAYVALYENNGSWVLDCSCVSVGPGATVTMCGSALTHSTHPFQFQWTQTSGGCASPTFTDNVGTVADGVTITSTWNCTDTDPAPVYYWNYCITNLTSIPMQVKWIGMPNDSEAINLAPGQRYCFTGSGTNWGVGGFVTIGWLPDGTATNMTVWPPTVPNTTNSAPSGPGTGGGNPGGPNGNPGEAGPGAGVGGSNTNLTGNQFYQGITNLDSRLGAGFGYIGGLQAEGNQTLASIGGMMFSVSNGVLTLVNDLQTNEFKMGVITNDLSASTNLLSAVVTNLSGLNSNTVTGFSNLASAIAGLSTNLGGGIGTNLPGSGESNGIEGAALSFSNGMMGFGAGWVDAGVTNVARSNLGNYWFISVQTNPLAAWDPNGHYDLNSGIDLDPRHSPWFIAFATFMRNIEVWLITLGIMWTVRGWMSERIRAILLTPTATNPSGYDPVALAQRAARLVFLLAVAAAVPVAMAALVYNFLNWPDHEVPMDPLGSLALGATGLLGPLLADAIDIVCYMFPVNFGAGALVYLGAVWTSLDAMTSYVQFKIKFVPF